MSNIDMVQIDGEWEITFGPTERSELERRAIAGVWHDTRDIDWISDLKEHHFRDPAAKDGFNALRQCLHKYKRVDMLLMREAMVGAGKSNSYSLLLAEEARGTITHSDVRSSVDLIIEMEFRRLAWVMAQDLIQDVQRRSLSIDQIRMRASTSLGQAFAGSDRKMAQSAQDIMLEYGDYLASRESESKAAEANGQAALLQGIPTPFCNLNALTSGGPTTGQVVYLGGWPGMGKSALGVDIGLDMAKSLACPGAVYYWTGEMSKAQLARRLAAKKRGVKIGHVKAAHVYEASEQVPGFWIDDDDEIDIHGLESRLQMFRVMYPGFRVAILDYILLLGPNDHKELSALSRRLVKLAKALGILIIGLQQLKTELQHRPDKRPTQSDLAECGQFQRDAGGIWMVHRPGFWKEDAFDQTEAYLYVRKNRDGPVGIVPLSWDAKTATYSEYIPVKKPPKGRDAQVKDEDQEVFAFPFDESITMEDIPL